MSVVNVIKLHKIMGDELAKVESYLDHFLHFEHQEIAEGALHTLHAGGKRLRPAVVIMTASFYNNADKVVPLAAAMELIHMASLIHDDIIDRSPTRRGLPTLNVTMGPAKALHTGDYVLTKALEDVYNLPRGKEIVKILGNLSMEMCYGEVEQINSMYDVKQTIEDYYYRINRKTALLIAVCCQVGALASNASPQEVQKFYDIGYNIGMAFQIKDDILDMEMSEKDLGKPAGSDLAHGIMTLPTILTLQKDFAEKEHLLDLIKSRFPKGQEQVQEALELIKKHHGIKEANQYCRRYIEQSKRLIDALPENKGKLVFKLGAEYVSSRGY